MCIAFPKATNSDSPQESTWKSILLLIPRLLELAWIVVRIMLIAMKNRLDHRREPTA